MKKSLLFIWLMILFIGAGCVISVNDHFDDKVYTKPYTTPSETNIIIITNDVVAVVTNDTGTVVTNDIETMITNFQHISNVTVISNEYYYTNDRYYTNTVTNNQYITNEVPYQLDVILTSPEAGTIVDGTVPVAGMVSDADNLIGAIVYMESTNGAMVKADYSAITGNQFNANISVSQQGCYQVWATVWDSTGAMGISEKVAYIADWTPPSIIITQPENNNVTVRLPEGSDTADFIIGGQITDDYSGGQQVYIQVDCCICIYIDTTGEFEKVITLSNGTHNISVTARDSAGYTSLPKLYTVTVQ